MPDIVDTLMAMRANYTYSVAATLEEAALEIKTLRTALAEMLDANERNGKWSNDGYLDDNWARVVEQAVSALKHDVK